MGNRVCLIRMMTLVLQALLLLAGGTAWAQPVEPKGTFEFRQDGLARDPLPWLKTDSTYIPTQTARVVLDSSEAQSVRVAELGTARLLITQETPPRLFCDYNGDGEYQDDEIYSPPLSYSYFMCEFSSVRVPVNLGNVTQTVLVDFSYYAFRSIQSLNIIRIQSMYEGSLTFGEEQYPARMVFTSLPTANEQVNLRVILDSNRDGVLWHFQDPWFVSQGIAVLNDALWISETTFSENQAEVTLRPYQGPVGTLKVEGQGLYRLYLQITDSRDNPAVSSGMEALLCLPLVERQTYQLPAAVYYTIHTAWLHPHPDAEEYYQFPAGNPPAVSSRTVYLAKDSTESVVLGGPLSQVVDIRPNYFSGIVTCDYKNLINPSGYSYQMSYGSRENFNVHFPLPTYTILDRTGNTVNSGGFQYG